MAQKYLAVGTLAAWNALGAGGQAKYENHYLNNKAANDFLVTLALDHPDDYDVEWISNFQESTGFTTPAWTGGQILRFVGFDFICSEQMTVDNVNLNTEDAIIIGCKFSQDVTKTLTAAASVTLSKSGTKVSECWFTGTDTTNGSGCKAAADNVTIEKSVFQDFVSWGVRPQNRTVLLEKCTFYNNSFDFAIYTIDLTVKNCYCKFFTATFTDGGGNTSSDSSAPEATRQNRAPVDSFEDLIDFVPKDVAWMVGVSPSNWTGAIDREAEGMIIDANIPEMYANISFLQTVKGNWVTEGDSLTQSWPPYATSTKLTRCNLNNVSTSGNRTDQMVTDYPTQVAPLKPGPNSELCFFNLLGGTNDIHVAIPALTIYNNLKTLWAWAKADGFIVIASTVPPSVTFDSPPSRYTTWVELNNYIISDPSLYNYIVRPELNEFLEDPTNTTYYYDGTHFAEPGDIVYAGLVSDAVDGGDKILYTNTLSIVKTLLLIDEDD